jgi:uncharacterized protein YaiI (UPF0178 family)
VFKIIVDADSCPVKQEVYRVAQRYNINVTYVANSEITVPTDQLIETVIVKGHMDAADDWIVEHIAKDDIAISVDILLASRCLKKGARVLGHHGLVFTEHSIGDAVATRDLMTHLRDIGINTGGRASFDKKDRSRFLQSLDRLVHETRRGA